MDAARLPLSAREKEIVTLLLEDLPDKIIGERLGLTHDTVRTYSKQIRRKLGVQSRVGVALVAVGYSHLGIKTKS